MKKLMAAVTCALAALFTYTSQASTWYVDAANYGKEGLDGSQTLPYGTIQAAVDVAGAGDTIKVLPGTYDQGAYDVKNETHNSSNFVSRCRVFVTKNDLTIESTGGRTVTKIKGYRGGKYNSNNGYVSYNLDGIGCVVINDGVTGLVIRGFTFEDGYYHQSGLSTIAGGGICRKTPNSDNVFLVTDSEFVHCHGRGAGGIVGGTAIRCIFSRGFTNCYGASAYLSRLYNCVSRNANLRNAGCGRDFHNCIVANCSSFDNAYYSTYRHEDGKFGGVYYNSLSAFNTGSSWTDEYGTAVNCVSDTSFGSEIDCTKISNSADDYTNIVVCAAAGNYKPVKNGLADNTGDYDLVKDLDFIPAAELEKDFNGNAYDRATYGWPVGVVLAPAEVMTGTLIGTGSDRYYEVNGVVSKGGSRAYYQSDVFPAELDFSVNTDSYDNLGYNAHSMMAMQLSYGNSNEKERCDFIDKRGKVRYMLPASGFSINMQAILEQYTYYVGAFADATPSDDNDGTSESAPFATIQKAMEVIPTLGVGKCTIIKVAPGTYGGVQGTIATDSASSFGSLEGHRATVVVPKNQYILVEATGSAEETVIKGAADPDTLGRGANATRCVIMHNLARCCFRGFTFRDGYGSTSTDSTGYGAIVVCGNYLYGQAYDSIFTANHGYGAVFNGFYQRCLFKENPECTNCAIYGNGRSSTIFMAALVSNCIFWNANGGSKYTLYNYVDAYNCTVYSTDSLATIHNINGRDVNSVYNVNATFPNFKQNDSPLIHAVVKAKNKNTQTIYTEEGVTYTDPYLTAPACGDFRLHLGSDGSNAAVGHATANYTGVNAGSTMNACQFTLFLHGDYYNNPLIGEDGTFNCGAVQETTPYFGSIRYADANNGDDANIGESEEKAVKTLKRAMELAADSPSNDKVTTVKALPGVYNEGQMEQDSNIRQSASNKRMAKYGTYFTVKARVMVPEGITLISRDGKDTTIIEGAMDPDYEEGADLTSTDITKWGCGPNATRCVILCKNSKVSGFTIRNGFSDYYSSNHPDQYEENVSYQDDYYGAVLGWGTDFAKRQLSVVEDCLITDCYADLGAAGGCVVLKDTLVKHCRAARYSPATRYGDLYNCYIEDCRGPRIFECVREAINVTVGEGCLNLSGSRNDLFDNVEGGTAALFENFLLIEPGNCKFKEATVKNLVAGSDSNYKTTATGTWDTETIYDNEYTSAQLKAMYQNGKAISKNAPSVDRGTSDAVSRIGDKDVGGAVRVLNGTIDIGAYEYDWKDDYAAALAKHGYATLDGYTSASVREANGKVTLSDGATISGALKGSDSEKSWSLTANLAGEGMLKVYVGGELVDTLTATGTIDFSTCVASSALRLEYSGTGSATLDAIKRIDGLMLIFN